MRKQIIKLLNVFRVLDIVLQKKIFIYRYVRYISNSSLIKEYKIYIEGIYKYRTCSSDYRLRRNIHRLEKGLSWEPRKPFFAGDYIHETISDYLELNDQITSKRWTEDVLYTYFKNIQEVPDSIEAIKEDFLSENPNLKPIEVPSTQNYKCSIEYDEFLQFLKQRKSIRSFLNKKVPNKIIERAITAASTSPSGCNRQAYKYYVVNNDHTKVQDILKISAGTKGWRSTVTNCIVLMGDMSAFNSINSRNASHIDSILSVMPFILSLRTMGIESCLINWAENPANEKKMRGILNAKKYEKVIITIAFGYPKIEAIVPYSSRKNSVQLINQI